MGTIARTAPHVEKVATGLLGRVRAYFRREADDLLNKRYPTRLTNALNKLPEGTKYAIVNTHTATGEGFGIAGGIALGTVFTCAFSEIVDEKRESLGIMYPIVRYPVVGTAGLCAGGVGALMGATFGYALPVTVPLGVVGYHGFRVLDTYMRES